MKFRTDFVTNSSSSNYISYNIKNKKLYDYIESLGIKIKSKGDGILDDGMEIVLPSGLVGKLDDSGENRYSKISSISDFVMETIEQSILSDYPEPDDPPEDWTEYEDEMMEQYRDELDELLPSHYAVSGMDGNIEYAHIRHEEGFERSIYVSEEIDVQNGIRTDRTPKESLVYGESMREFDFSGCPGKIITQECRSGNWFPVSRPSQTEQKNSDQNSDEEYSIENLYEKIESMSTDEAKEYLVELLTSDVISNEDFGILYEELE